MGWKASTWPRNSRPPGPASTRPSPPGASGPGPGKGGELWRSSRAGAGAGADTGPGSNCGPVVLSRSPAWQAGLHSRASVHVVGAPQLRALAKAALPPGPPFLHSVPAGLPHLRALLHGSTEGGLHLHVPETCSKDTSASPHLPSGLLTAAETAITLPGKMSPWPLSLPSL